MTTLTNNHNLPDPVVRALSYDDYDQVGDISITGLLKPVQARALEELHADDLPPEDVSERVWRLYGSAAHEFLYRSRDKDAVIAEKRLTMDVAGWTVSGKPDTYDLTTQELTDFKTTSVWSLVFEPKGRREWHEQMNLYRLLLEEHGHEVKSMQVIAILRDWAKRDVGKQGYPAIPIVCIDIPVWSRAEAEAFLLERVTSHKTARERGTWADCTDEERWLGKKGYARCEGYCRASVFCPQLARERA